MNNKFVKESLVEFIGTFILVFIGGLAVVVAAQFGVVVPALAHGLAVLSIIYAYGHISGAHVNPAVTLAFWVGGKIAIDKAVYYWVAQFVGGIAAAVVIALVLASNANVGETTGSLTQDAVWRAALLEALLTFIFISTIYQAAGHGKAGDLAGLVIGLTLAGCILAGGAFTGAALNPARALGPALVAGNLSYIVPYLLGIFAGGAAAGFVQSRFFKNS